MSKLISGSTSPATCRVQVHLRHVRFVVWQLYRVLEVPQSAVSVDEKPSAPTARSDEKKGTDKHKCDICSAAFPLRFLLYDHMKNKHANVKCKTCSKWFLARTVWSTQCSDCEKKGDSAALPDVGLKCEICGRRCWSKRAMQKHHWSVHGNFQCHPCKICGKPFKKLNEALAHEDGHRGLNLYKCSICSSSFSFSLQLDDHMKRIHTEGARFKCDLCDKTFRYGSGLKGHQANAHSTTRYRCADCPNTYRSKGNLNAHRRIHLPGYVPEKITCKVCHATFISRGGYKRHRKLHEIDAAGRTFVCETCGKSISSLPSFMDHLRTHTGEKPFQCHECGKAFTSKKYFVAHSRVHTKEKPYKCHMCDSRFTQRGSLTIHVRKHTGDCPYTCHVCDKSFPVKTLLRTHMKVHTKCRNEKSKSILWQLYGIVVVPTTPGSGVSAESPTPAPPPPLPVNNISDPLRTNPSAVPEKNPPVFVCELCDKRYKSKYTMIKHVASAHKDEICETCGGRSKKIEFKCDRCDKTFRFESSLWSHKRRIHETANVRTYAKANSKRKMSKFACNVLSWQFSEWSEGMLPMLYCVPCNKSFLTREKFTRHNYYSHTEGKVPCEVCGKLFKSMWYLKAHSVVHQSHSVECDICNRTFKHAKSLGQHKSQAHYNAGKWNCKQCEKEYITAAGLVAHVKTAHLGVTYTCDVCKRTYLSESHFKIHQRNHEIGNVRLLYTCMTCGDQLSSKSSLKRHMRIHKENFLYICDVCGKGLRTPQSFRNHSRIHSGEKPFGCHECGKTFVSKERLTEHVRVHTKEKPYGCGVCGKSFTQQHSLKVHARLHTGERPYRCHICEKAFIVKPMLVSHLKMHDVLFEFRIKDEPVGDHTVYYVITIDDDGEEFQTLSAVNAHPESSSATISSVAEDQQRYQCSVCDNLYLRRRGLHDHMRSHRPREETPSKRKRRRRALAGDTRYKCYFCEKSFKLSFYRAMHERTHTGEKPHVCSFCGRGFSQRTSMVMHLRTHTGEKPFTCQLCGKAYTSKSAVKVHTKKCMKKLLCEFPKDEYACMGCERRFKSRNGLTRHAHGKGLTCKVFVLEKCTTNDRFQCDVCLKFFKRPNTLRAHKKRVHDELTCDTKFGSKRHLLHHREQVHSDITYKCPDCGKVYGDQAYFNSHRRIHVHRLFTCFECNRQLASKISLRRHIKAHRADQCFVCDSCGKSVKTMKSLVTHLRTHSGEKPFGCATCGKRFIARERLIEHERVHTKEKPYACSVCAKRFSQCGSLKIHLRQHTGERPYACNICGKAFMVKALLGTHMKAHGVY
ncbi:zinc finger protein 62 homolog [Photinus pyralis]|uniref:zinc finger protein 62 homolog n=1 Tax=Photinus pyralis TaxID=7054 RepID=UPI0012677FE8|nr:zinc finger protein 62 homolog [Photinus pyralis]